MEVIKGSRSVCVCVCVCVIKGDSGLYRGTNYCVIGLSQPRYVMPNLVAKSTSVKEKNNNYKLPRNVQYVCERELIT